MILLKSSEFNPDAPVYCKERCNFCFQVRIGHFVCGDFWCELCWPDAWRLCECHFWLMKYRDVR